MDLRNIQPLLGRVLVRASETEAVSPGGIIIPENKKTHANRGEVIAISPGVKVEGGKIVPHTVKVGDVVLFGKYSGTEVEIDPKVKYVLIEESELLGVVAISEPEIQDTRVGD